MVWLVNASVASAAVLLLNIHPAIAVQLLSPVAKSPLLIILLQVVIGFGMRIDSFAVAVPPLLSEMVYGNWTRPIYPLVGTKVKNPVLDDITVPHVTAIDCVVPELIVTPLIVVIVSVCPSASLSPDKGERLRGVLDVPVYISSIATGGVLQNSVDAVYIYQSSSPPVCLNSRALAMLFVTGMLR
jgi:hypothetical protein